MKKFLSYLMTPGLILLLGMQACINDDLSLCEAEPPVTNPPRAIKFASRNLNTPATRTSADGDSWLTGDKIGIYMMNTGTAITTNLAANRRYIGTMRPSPYSHIADFTPDAFDQTIYYPTISGVTALDFIAYYPWKPEGIGPGEINNNLYPIDVTSQSYPAGIDLLYSYDVKNHQIPTANTSHIDLGFRHMLSKIILNVGKKAGSDIVIPGMTAALQGMPIKGTIDLGDTLNLSLGTDKSAIKMLGLDHITLRPANYDTTYQAIIIPHEVTAAGSEKVQLIGGEGRQFTWTIPAIHFHSGLIYTYNLTLIGENLIEFTGTINHWGSGGNNYDIVDHDQSGVVSKYVLPNAIDSMNVVYIRAGEFIMGMSGEPNATPHRVMLSQGFRIGEAEITNAQYARFLNAINVAQPTYPAPTDVTADISALLADPTLNAAILFKTTAQTITWDAATNKWAAAPGKANHPASSISWYGAKAYARWAGGDLPTEAQWEYAARAKTTPGSNYIGSISGTDAGIWAWFDKTETDAVKTRTPNSWNLYDMFGNVAEWTRDQVSIGSDYPYGTLQQTDPCDNASPYVHPLRGGSYATPAAADLKISARNTTGANTPGTTLPEAGFRVLFR
ncbi:MAG: SUMF1/EgtB/PvdO family nonheme iron enzyme [Tannerellaceae bacterium]|jgi:formylglycine-generating enzyme required for sulfatase activity|nr:SUMF1/EgtB/PvdO family nonheme iron enzyme [Tannerellaceae bacterium]